MCEAESLDGQVYHRSQSTGGSQRFTRAKRLHPMVQCAVLHTAKTDGFVALLGLLTVLVGLGLALAARHLAASTFLFGGGSIVVGVC